MIDFLRRLIIVITLVFVPFQLATSSFGMAQQAQSSPDYQAWEKAANQAEIALTQKRASDAALDGLRDTLVEWRGTFLTAADTGSARVETLKNQIDALGPVPTDGTSEPTEIAERRASLLDELAAARAPQSVAEEAYSRANGLIGEVDKIIRDRRTARLFENQGTPLVPTLWYEAYKHLSDFARRTSNESTLAFQNNQYLFLSLRELPATVFFAVLGIVLLLLGRKWMVRLTRFVQGESGTIDAGFRGFLVSLGQFLVPVLGIMALLQAISISGLLGFRGQLIAGELLVMGIAFFGARWLSWRLLPPVRWRKGFLQLSAKNAGVFRRYAAALSVVWGLNHLLVKIGEYESIPSSSFNVLQFPLVVLAGGIMFRMGRLLRTSVRTAISELNEEASFRIKSVNWFGTALMVTGAAGPVAMAVGFAKAGSEAVFSSVLTLALFALVTVLAGVLRDLYALLSRKDDEAARQSLFPVLVSFALVFLSLPVLALIWGARFSDLTEMWTKFQEGVSLGEVTISPGTFLTLVVVFSIGYLATRLLQSTLRNSVLPKTKIDLGGQSAMVSGVGYVGIFLAALIAISTAGIDLSSLAIVAGALSVGIGFGLQNIVSNFVSGIILLVERPITEGDWIQVGGHEGTVREISVRSTRIKTFDRSEVIIPNSDLVSGAVTNLTRGNLFGRCVVPVGVAYGSDTRQVQRILAEASLVHPLVYDDPPPGVHLRAFGADSIDFEIRAVIRDVNHILTVQSEILHEVNRRFVEEGIEIPFAQRDIWLRNPETLRGDKDPSPNPKDK